MGPATPHLRDNFAAILTRINTLIRERMKSFPEIDFLTTEFVSNIKHLHFNEICGRILTNPFEQREVTCPFLEPEKCSLKRQHLFSPRVARTHVLST